MMTRATYQGRAARAGILGNPNSRASISSSAQRGSISTVKNPNSKPVPRPKILTERKKNSEAKPPKNTKTSAKSVQNSKFTSHPKPDKPEVVSMSCSKVSNNTPQPKSNPKPSSLVSTTQTTALKSGHGKSNATPTSASSSPKLPSDGKALSHRTHVYTPHTSVYIPGQSSAKPKKLTNDVTWLRKENANLMEQVNTLKSELEYVKEMYGDLLASQTRDTGPCESHNVAVVSNIETRPAHPPDTVPEPDNTEDLIYADTTDHIISPNINTETVVPDDQHRKHRVLIVGDSMTRNFGSILQNLLPDHTVTCYTYPGAKFVQVVQDLESQTMTFSQTDTVVILAGTNDVPYLHPQLLYQIFHGIKNVFSRTRVIISSVPYMFQTSRFNTNIFATNQCLLRLCRIYKCYMFNCNYVLSRKMYTKHGLHFNTLGKEVVCSNLMEVILLNQSNDSMYCNIRYNVPSVDVTSGATAATNCINFPSLADVTCPTGFDDTLLDDSNASLQLSPGPQDNTYSACNTLNNVNTQNDIILDETFSFTDGRNQFFRS
uniref:SGNH hydrolase-type esterase domain-containing protein n=1 Tax=Cacopsylla melanoneura TaxID=428564 RepID=A0A8D8YJJ1_9HEMI